MTPNEREEPSLVRTEMIAQERRHRVILRSLPDTARSSAPLRPPRPAFVLARRKKSPPRPPPESHPSMKIVSSRPFSSWNCRSMSSSWKSGTSSGVQYPEKKKRRGDPPFIPPVLSLLPCLRSRAFLSTRSNEKLREGSFGNSIGCVARGKRIICFVTRTRPLARPPARSRVRARVCRPKKQRILF